jgi:hypothetical protein
MNKRSIIIGIVLACTMLVVVGCDWLNLSAPVLPTTKEKMLGVWQVTEAYDENNVSILGDINFPITAFQLSDANSVNSTAGPMFMKIVYGKSKYTQIASYIDQVFNYSNLDLTEGEWFIGGGYPDTFTIEMKLEGLPGEKSLTSLLNILGIAQNYLDVTVYHKFLSVHVDFPDTTDTTMVWKFDSETHAVYNTKDNQGYYVFWSGWPTTTFGHFTFVLTKRVPTIRQLIQGG